MARGLGPNGKLTMPRLKRAGLLRDRGLSYPAIHAAMDVYEGEAPSAVTIRKYLLAQGYPKTPRGNSFGSKV